MNSQHNKEQNPIQQTSDASAEPINKGYLQSQLLIAMPGLDDPYFKKSVTLICQHDENGCFGLTINKPMEISFDEIFKQLNIETNDDNSHQPSESDSSQHSNKPSSVIRGGPVQAEQGFVIHDSQKQWENTMLIDEALAVTASSDILIDIAAGKGPENYLLALGCASWTAGQIESEIMENSWLNCPIDKDILFEMPFAQRWQGAADTLGINLHSMSGASGHD